MRALRRDDSDPPRIARAPRQSASPLDELVIEQRCTHFERVLHARTIDFHEDVARQITLDIEVLNARQSIVGRRAYGVPAHDFDRSVTLQL